MLAETETYKSRQVPTVKCRNELEFAETREAKQVGRKVSPM